MLPVTKQDKISALKKLKKDIENTRVFFQEEDQKEQLDSMNEQIRAMQAMILDYQTDGCHRGVCPFVNLIGIHKH